jgi:hypothetical protein
MILTLFVALFKGMISYMNKKVFLLGMVVMASFCFVHVCVAEPRAEPRAEPNQVLLLQDENSFLQDDIKKLQADLIDKDNALKKIVLERESARYDRDVAIKEKEAFEKKVFSLHKMITARDDEMVQNVELAVVPYRSRMEDALNELKIMTMAMEQKNVRMAQIMQENDVLQKKISILTAEKLSLLQSLKKLAAEYDAFKLEVNIRLTDAKSGEEQKIKDLEVRLAAEKTLVQEKIAQAKKPLEDNIAGMEAACQVREAEVAQKENLAQALLQEKVRKLEQRLVILRENSALEVKKVQEACRGVSKDPKAIKK